MGNVLDLTGHGSNSFDIVLNGHGFHCIIGRDRAQFLREAFRVLKAAGVFYLNTMCGDPGCEEHRQPFDPQARCLIRDGVAVRYLGGRKPGGFYRDEQPRSSAQKRPGSGFAPAGRDETLNGFCDSLSPLRAFPTPGSQPLADRINNQYAQT
jgi:SAM-dependent methyltransferase